MEIANLAISFDCSTRYPLLLGGQRQAKLPFAKDFHSSWNLNLDHEFLALTIRSMHSILITEYRTVNTGLSHYYDVSYYNISSYYTMHGVFPSLRALRWHFNSYYDSADI